MADSMPDNGASAANRVSAHFLIMLGCNQSRVVADYMKDGRHLGSKMKAGIAAGSDNSQPSSLSWVIIVSSFCDENRLCTTFGFQNEGRNCCRIRQQPTKQLILGDNSIIFL
jgi:hypothetical protein